MGRLVSYLIFASLVIPFSLPHAASYSIGFFPASTSTGGMFLHVHGEPGARVSAYVPCTLDGRWPFASAFVADNGMPTFRESISDEMFVRAHAGPVRTGELPNVNASGYCALFWLRIPTTDGTIIFLWSDVQPPPTFEIYSEANATVAFQAETPDAFARPLNNFTGVGSHAGGLIGVETTEVGSTHVFAAPERRAFAWTHYTIDETLGAGFLRVRADDDKVDIDLTSVQDPNNNCLCFREGVVFSEGEGEKSASMVFAGLGRTNAEVNAVLLPPGLELLHRTMVHQDFGEPT